MAVEMRTPTEPRSDRLETVRRFFEDSRNYLAYDAVIDLRTRAVSELVQRRGPMRMLDLGCGDGRISISLLRPGDSLVLVDATANMLAAARARVPGAYADAVSFVETSIEAFRPGDRFDLVFCLGVLAHVSNVDATFAHVASLVGDDGSLIVQISDHGRLSTRVLHAISNARRNLNDRRGYALNDVTCERLMGLAQRHGLHLAAEKSHWRLLPGMRLLPIEIARRLLNFGYDNARVARHGSERLIRFTRPPLQPASRQSA